MCASRLLASCCLVCLVVPVASLAQPKNSKTATTVDSSNATVSLHELQIPEKAPHRLQQRRATPRGKRLRRQHHRISEGDRGYDEFYEAYYKLGIANLELQINDAAEAAFRKSIDLSDSKFAPPLFGLGLTLGNEKQFADAETYIRAGLQLEPTSAPGLLRARLGFVLRATRRRGRKIRPRGRPL